MKRILFIFILLSSNIFAQEKIYDLVGSEFESGFGLVISGLKDHNQDGINDFAVLEASTNKVYLFSGANGQLLNTFEQVDSQSYGNNILSLPDINNDGIPEIIISDSRATDVFLNPDSGVIYIYSGNPSQNFNLLFDLELFIPAPGSPTNARFGTGVAVLGDINNNGFPEIAGGASRFESSRGLVRVQSANKSSTPWTIENNVNDEAMGYNLLAIEDQNNDGIKDLLVAFPSDDIPGNNGKVQLLSGANGSVITTLFPPANHYVFGCAMRDVGDVTGDGVPDFAISAVSKFNDNFVNIRIYSGADLSIYRNIPNTPFFCDNGNFAGIGDINGDGFDEIIVGDSSDINSDNIVSFKVVSGKTGEELLLSNGSFSEEFAYSVSGLGDINNDLYPEVLVTSLQGDNRFGKVSVYDVSPKVTNTDIGVNITRKGNFQLNIELERNMTFENCDFTLYASAKRKRLNTRYSRQPKILETKISSEGINKTVKLKRSIFEVNKKGKTVRKKIHFRSYIKCGKNENLSKIKSKRIGSNGKPITFRKYLRALKRKLS